MNYTSPSVVSIFFYLLVVQISVFVAVAAADSSRAPAVTTDSPPPRRKALRRSATTISRDLVDNDYYYGSNNIDRVNGIKELLVIRVESSTDDSSSSSYYYSQDQLIKQIFTDEITVVKQYKACSRGKFILNPAQGPTIKNGVATIQLNYSIKGKDILDEYKKIVTIGNGQFGKDLKEFSHVMICMPEGTLKDGNNW